MASEPAAPAARSASGSTLTVSVSSQALPLTHPPHRLPPEGVHGSVLLAELVCVARRIVEPHRQPSSSQQQHDCRLRPLSGSRRSTDGHPVAHARIDSCALTCLSHFILKIKFTFHAHGCCLSCCMLLTAAPNKSYTVGMHLAMLFSSPGEYLGVVEALFAKRLASVAGLGAELRQVHAQ